MSKKKSGGGKKASPVYSPEDGVGFQSQAPEQVAADAPEQGQAIDGYDGQGNPIQVNASQAPKLFAAGQLYFAKDQTVNVKDNEGKIFAANAEQAAAALKSGYGVATQGDVDAALERKEYDSVGKTVKAGVAGLARGATLGLSDKLAVEGSRAFGGDASASSTAKELTKLKETSPIVSGASELAGAVAPVLLSGGAAAPEEAAAMAAGRAGAEVGGSALAAGVRAAGAIPRGVAAAGGAAGRVAEGVVGNGATSLLGKVAQKALPLAVQGGVEGAAYGAGGEISESALGDHELNAEKLLAASAHGAAWGAAGGAVLGAGEVAAKAVGEKALRAMTDGDLSDTIKKFADERLMKSYGLYQKRDLAALEKGGLSANIGASGEELAQPASKLAARQEELANTARNYRLENGERIWAPGESYESLANKAQQGVEEQSQKLAAIRQETRNTVASNPEIMRGVGGNFVKQVEKEIISPLEESLSAAQRSKAARLRSELETLQESLAPVDSLPKNHPWANLVEAHGADSARKQILEHVPDNQLAAMVEKDGALKSFLYPKETTLEALESLSKDWKVNLYPSAKGLRIPPEHEQEWRQMNGILTDHLEQITEKAAQASGREELMTQFIDAKKAIHDLRPLQEIAEKAVIRKEANRFVSPSDYGTGLSGAVASAALGHAGPMALAAGVMTGAAHKFLREKASGYMARAADVVVEKLNAMAAIQRATRDVDAKVSQGIDGFLSSRSYASNKLPAATAYLSTKATKESSFAGHREQLTAELASPEKHLARVSEQVSTIASHAPATATAVAQKASAAQAFLASKMPEPKLRESTLQPNLKQALPPPSKADLAKYARYAAAVQNPMTVIDDMKHGRISPEGVEALKTVYPKLYQQVTTQVTTKLAESKRPLSHDKKLQLGVLLGIPTTETIDPAFMKSVGSMYQSSQQKKSGGQSPSGPRRPVTGAERQLLPSQSLDR